MNWYWIENQQRQGPITDDALRALVDSGRVGPETLVWRDGFAGWTPWREVQPAPAPASPTPTPAPVQTPQARPGAASIDADAGGAISSAAVLGQPAAAAPRARTANHQAVETDTCTQCRKIFPKDELLGFENDRVCAQCKPLYLQSLKEGVRSSAVLVYAGFWVRFGAKFVDGLILGVPTLALFFFLAMPAVVAAAQRGQRGNPAATCLLQLAFYCLSAAYQTWFVGRFGATPGKMAMKLKIVRSDGGRVTYGRAFGRFFAEILSTIILDIGYIMAAFDDEKRALHDRICDTRVIRV
jgi:uncharacterized RDD family membrane protein YckC